MIQDVAGVSTDAPKLFKLLTRSMPLSMSRCLQRGAEISTLPKAYARNPQLAKTNPIWLVFPSIALSWFPLRLQRTSLRTATDYSRSSNQMLVCSDLGPFRTERFSSYIVPKKIAVSRTLGAEYASAGREGAPSLLSFARGRATSTREKMKG
jgi:hypothetical protein